MQLVMTSNASREMIGMTACLTFNGTLWIMVLKTSRDHRNLLFYKF